MIRGHTLPHRWRFIMKTGQTQRWGAPKGCFVGETPFAARGGAVEDDDVYQVTYRTNLTRGKGECVIFDARDITVGPICRVILTGPISRGGHAVWTSATELHGARA